MVESDALYQEIRGRQAEKRAMAKPKSKESKKKGKVFARWAS